MSLYTGRPESAEKPAPAVTRRKSASRSARAAFAWSDSNEIFPAAARNDAFLGFSEPEVAVVAAAVAARLEEELEAAAAAAIVAARRRPARDEAAVAEEELGINDDPPPPLAAAFRLEAGGILE